MQAQERLQVFENVNLSRGKVLAIKCYLTGYEQDNGSYNVCRYGFTDKHGFKHMVFNAKVNLHRANGAEIYLNRMTGDLDMFDANRVDTAPPEGDFADILITA